MKNVSKVLSALLVLVMVIGMFAMTATAAAGDTANLVTDVSTLQAGDKVILVGSHNGTYYAASTASSNNNRKSVVITVAGVTATLTADTDIFTVGAGSVDGSISLSNSSGYLYAASGSSNHLKFTSTLNGNASFKVVGGTLVAQGSNARKYMYCNENKQNGDPLFSCYADKSGDSTYCPVSLYKIGAAPAPVPATAISIDATANVMTGFSTTLTAAVTPADSTDSVSWSSSNEEVATVVNGKIAGLKVGTATITVTAGNVSDTCVVTVADNAWTIVDAPVTGPFKLGMAQYSAGKMVYFTGATDNADYRLAGTENADDAVDMYLEAVTGGYHLYFLDAANNNAKTYIEIYEYQANSGSLKLTTDTPATALTYNEAVKTLVGTIGTNSYYLGAYSSFTNISTSKTSYILEDDGSAKDAVDATQFPARLYQMKVSSVVLSNTTANVAVNDTLNLTATVNPSNASNPAVTWTSSDATIASVNNGVVTAHKVGTVTITATADGKSATCAVTVVPETIPAEKVELDKATAELVAGKELNLTGVVTPPLPPITSFGPPPTRPSPRLLTARLPL